jgi:hypothetical protein
MRVLGGLAIALVFGACAGPGPKSPAPPGRFTALAYYSDEYALEGDVHRLGEEKNLEEVYQYYTYYEAIHDEEQRVVIFKKYLRGDLDWTERYTYDRKGSLAQKERIRPGQRGEVTHFDR